MPGQKTLAKEWFQIRYTCSGDLQLRIVDFITRNALRFIIAREVASREHIQCYVELDITKKTWVNKFNESFPGMDRRDKYVMIDNGKTCNYVCKDGDIIAKRGFSNEDIENFKTEYHKENPKPEISIKIDESLILPPEKKTEKVKKQKVPPFMQLVRQELEDMHPNLQWHKKHKPLVFKMLMNKLGEGCKNLDHVIISRMTYGVLNSLIKDKKDWHEYWYMKAFGETLNCDDVENMALDD